MRDAASWRPIGVESLEPAADEVVRSTGSRLVVAGPGAGKTELLAQRACYLLQTGACAPPRRILAISFKRDAARNLEERVAQRCGRDLAARFDSFTFDSFAKSLVDRFLDGVPDPFRPTPNYEVDVGATKRSVKQCFVALPADASTIRPSDRKFVRQDDIWEALISRELRADGSWSNRTNAETAAAELWSYYLRGKDESLLSFPMIGRVAGLLLEANPMVVQALRCAYPFVFLDEYQDTTRVQYALVRLGFKGSSAVLTAVGDKKQRIMGWAGAMERAFDEFVTDFQVQRVALVRNYRSAQGLVAIQGVLAEAIDTDVEATTSMRSGAEEVDECRVLCFDRDDDEAEYVAELVRGWIERDGVAARDICILCRMKESTYAHKLMQALEQKGVRSRLEGRLQDLLAEPVVEAALDVLRLSCRPRDAQAWQRTTALRRRLDGDESGKAEQRRVASLIAHGEASARSLEGVVATREQVEAQVRRCVEFLGEKELREGFPQYLRGPYFEDCQERLIGVLHDAIAASGCWSDAIDEVLGAHSVPIMTTHKSKGLEYHSVVFIGLEDDALFGFKGDESQRVEEMCGVFVALSRAKARAIFTFCRMRTEKQSRSSIGLFYDLLAQAGVELEKV